MARLFISIGVSGIGCLLSYWFTRSGLRFSTKALTPAFKPTFLLDPAMAAQLCCAEFVALLI